MSVSIVICTLSNKIPKIKQNYKNYKVIVNREKIGISRARNRGWKNNDSDFFIFLDDDITHLRTDLIEKSIKKFQKNPRLGLLGVRSIHIYRNEKKVLNFLKSHVLELGNSKIQYVSGSCMIFRRQCLQDLNGFDENIEYGDDDLDISIRTIRSKWKIGFLDDALYLIHQHTEKMPKDERKRKFENSRKYLQKKYNIQIKSDFQKIDEKFCQFSIKNIFRDLKKYGTTNFLKSYFIKYILAPILLKLLDI